MIEKLSGAGTNEEILTLCFYLYIIIINIVSALITVIDKSRAKRHKWRISEFTLIMLSVLGGSVSMLLTMCLIHHKTKKPKFMVGIPVIIAIQTVLCYFIYQCMSITK